ncbi:hypothetical protein DI272_27830 [Streptomyces sp. Act143]|uniref:nSTAND1 domain-containing NTPase n=1 Tax=Streptomyces sp. Act143 TaxID=2200760 RepID=UPI000D6720D0|nr:TIR domain-containing protein [Streptomyces sp. Act143]PWI17549.1 hypothetical protein DI272_27830 [Streptomyces sp. Act143]
MIVTFYSYKGGVGRSMALANIADQLARSGMRVLMVDFDLEAPGLEHFFPIDHGRVRGREGLLDLLLAFKYAMSVASSAADEGAEDAYRDLDRYISTVYPPRSDGGRLDLLPAGLRLTDDQMTRYGAELRRFDWQDFYYVWSGELFFEWFRRACAERYDIVLVDSRTGVTELGGVCAYQLADVIVALCAANLQNVEGTEWMVRHFLSPQVRAVRGDRPLEALVVPARIDQQDAELLADFAHRFRRSFDTFTPEALRASGLGFWELQVPYVPAYAFDEQVITDPGRAQERRSLARAYDSLRNAIALLAPSGNRLARLRSEAVLEGSGRQAVEPVVTQYDPTSRFAQADVYLSYSGGDREVAGRIRDLLEARDVRVAEPDAPAGTRLPTSAQVSARLALFLVGELGQLSPWQQRELAAVVNAGGLAQVLPVMLPGTGQPPYELRELQFLDYRAGLEPDGLVEAVRASLRTRMPTEPEPALVERSPYLGLQPFSEADAAVFFGRGELVDRVLDSLRTEGRCTIVGGAASGKTSLVNAGVIPALRRGVLPGSELWRIVRVNHSGGIEQLQALRQIARKGTVVVLDQFEELFTLASADQRDVIYGLLVELAKDPDVSARLITVLRADFVAQARSHAPALMKHTVAVPPMSEREMREAVEKPALAAGLHLEPGLTERLLQDMGDEPGALPLLQFTLREMWKRREDGYLTHRSYQETGGIQGSLAHTAEEVFASFSEDDRSRARDLLLHLVTVDADGRYWRQALPVAYLSLMETEGVCERMVQERLLVISAEAGNEPQVLLAHHALISAWPRFQAWVDQAGAELSLRQQLKVAARDWVRSGRRREGLLSEPPSLLYRTPGRTTAGFTPLEMEYVLASTADARRTRVTKFMATTLLGVALMALLTSVLLLSTGAPTLWPLILLSLSALSSLPATLITIVRRGSGRRSLMATVEP